MVELDQMKQELQTYESPLAEVRDSLLPRWQGKTDRRIGAGNGSTGILG